MTINNYSVAVNAQYFNLQKDSLETTIMKDGESFNSPNSMNVDTIDNLSFEENTKSSELSLKLSEAILKNVSSEANRSLKDRLEMTYTYEESQALNYQVKAIIKTDTKEIKLSLNISLSRNFSYKSNMSIENLQALQDPLVISLNGKIPSLSSTTFAFDIDNDGKKDQISELNAGSGFLALDINSNGKVDNGNELFGTASGNGFSDLSKYDDDKNGWIDKNDAIFDKLRVWKKSKDKNELIALGEVGVGAIFLGATTTPFSLKTDTNELLGEIKKSSFVLYENGSAGVISQIDLAINTKTVEGINLLDDASKTISKFKLNNIYNTDSKSTQKNESSVNKKIEVMQKKIQELESKLIRSNEEERALIQVQIATLLSQMMGILESELA